MIEAVREDRGRTVLRTLRGTEPWRPCVVYGSPCPARVALVQTRASLIAGDDVSISVTVGAGATLEIVELGATLAHDGRGGPIAQLRATIEVAEGGLLIWESKPLIAGAGCRALRVTEARVATGGRMMIGESVVLGRAGQAPGELTSQVSIWHQKMPIVIETLSTRDRSVLGSSAVAGASRMVAGLTLSACATPSRHRMSCRPTDWPRSGVSRQTPCAASQRLPLCRGVGDGCSRVQPLSRSILASRTEIPLQRRT